MAIRVESAELAGLLTDLAATATKPEGSEATSAVLVHSARGHHDGEPGRTDLLVGTSTTRWSIGHGYLRAQGQLAGPMLWPLGDVHTLIAALRRKSKTDGRDKHAVRIGRAGDLVEITEDPAQPSLLGGELWSMRFPVGDLDDYPRGAWDRLRSASRAFTPVRDQGREVAPLPRTDVDPALLRPFVAIGVRRGYVVEIYRWHQRLPVHIQIGPAYRGMLVPLSYADGPGDQVTGREPDAEVYDPGLPPRPEPPHKPNPAGPHPVDLDDLGGGAGDV